MRRFSFTGCLLLVALEGAGCGTGTSQLFGPPPSASAVVRVTPPVNPVPGVGLQFASAEPAAATTPTPPAPATLPPAPAPPAPAPAVASVQTAAAITPTAAQGATAKQEPETALAQAAQRPRSPGQSGIGLTPRPTPPPKLGTPGATQVPELPGRLTIPQGLPGAQAPPLEIPPREQRTPEEREREIRRIFPELPAVPPMPASAEQGTPLTLHELQEMALRTNPVVVQATARIQSARGTAIQSGLAPNPVVGYEGDTVGSAGTPNYHGVFVTQTVMTAGKLDLARAAANVDVANAELELKRARIELLAQVRGAYFTVIVARENVRANRSLVELTDEVYRIQLDRMRAEEVAPYEVAQLRSLAVQARTALVQAQNRALSSWRQLAAAVGVPEMPPAPLADSPETPLPNIDFDTASAYMLANNTAILAARNMQGQARLNLRRAEVTPIPDIQFYGTVQRDFTTAPLQRTTWNMQLGLPVPIFDRNQGNILAAQGNLVRTSFEETRVRNDLMTQLAQSFELYSNNRTLVQYYRNEILPAQAQAYRSIYTRYNLEPDMVGFGDLVVAQQTLLNSITSYVGALGAQWTAVTNIATLLQVEDLTELDHLTHQNPQEMPLPPPVIPAQPPMMPPRKD